MQWPVARRKRGWSIGSRVEECLLMTTVEYKYVCRAQYNRIEVRFSILELFRKLANIRSAWTVTSYLG